jgi:succinylglutamate desuccinylase
MRFLNKEIYLRKFDELKAQLAGPIPASISLGNSTSKPHLVVGSAVHGDEIGSIPAIIDFIQATLQNPITKGRITFFLGNKPAIELNKRFVDFDLNRILGVSGSSPEHSRANELATLLETADFFIDLHQTIQPTKSPFYISLDHPSTLAFAEFLDATDVFVVDHELPADQLSTEQYTLKKGKPALSIEIGPIGMNPESHLTTQRLLEAVRRLVEDPNAAQKKFSNKISAKLKKYRMAYQVKYQSPDDRLLAGWKNFDPINRGQILGTRAQGEPILSPESGHIFFPKYPDAKLTKLPKNICEIAVEIVE